MKNTWSTRIKARMKELGMTQEDLAKKVGITRGAITHYLSGRRVPPLKQFQKIAIVLKTNPAWLQFGTSHKTEITKSERTSPSKSLLPIIPWEEIPDFYKNKSSKNLKEFMPNLYTDNSAWYVLRIKGDSMTSSLSQSRSFHNGDFIIVDPEKDVHHGHYVIALLPNSKEATFKQYVVDGGIHYLKPLNPQYPIVQIDKKTLIFGVVIGCISNLL